MISGAASRLGGGGCGDGLGPGRRDQRGPGEQQCDRQFDGHGLSPRICISRHRFRRALPPMLRAARRRRAPPAGRGASSAPSQRATTIVATALPMKLVRLRHSDMKRSMPRISASPATGTVGTIDSVAASVMKPAPVTPAAPFETEHRDRQQRQLLATGQIDPARLRDEQRRQRHVDVGAIEIEANSRSARPARRRALRSRHRSILAIRLGSAASDDEVPSTSSNSALADRRSAG